MIKGVNKQVLEINETQNGFFEKAIFFVKPEYSGMSEGRLRESAKEEIENAGRPPKRKFFQPQYKFKAVASLLGAFAIGLIIGIVATVGF